MLEKGYIKISRKFLNWRWYDEDTTFRVFMHLLMTANYEDKKWNKITVKRGQRITSYRMLSFELKKSINTVKLHLERLVNTGEITIKSTNNYTIITIPNYSQYQDGLTVSGSVSDSVSDTGSGSVSGGVSAAPESVSGGVSGSVSTVDTQPDYYVRNKEIRNKKFMKEKKDGMLSPLDAAEQPEKKLPDFDLSINRF